MSSVARTDWGAIALRGIAAGIAGGILIEAFLYVTAILPAHGTLAGQWTWIASTVLGKAAFTMPSAWAIGLLLHVLVAIGWAVGYAYLDATTPAIAARPAISGVIYGIFVYVMMQIVLLGDNAFHWPTAVEFLDAVVAHAIFYGLPVALVVSSLRGASA
jgi:hypothetical protein